MFVSHAQGAVSAQENWRQFDKAMYEEYNVLTEELVINFLCSLFFSSLLYLLKSFKWGSQFLFIVPILSPFLFYHLTILSKLATGKYQKRTSRAFSEGRFVSFGQCRVTRSARKAN
jgi:hypothetical protein